VNDLRVGIFPVGERRPDRVRRGIDRDIFRGIIGVDGAERLSPSSLACTTDIAAGPAQKMRRVPASNAI